MACVLKNPLRRALAAGVSLAAMAGLAAAQDGPITPPEEPAAVAAEGAQSGQPFEDLLIVADADPLEPFNRRMYGLHTTIDRTALVPTARGYRRVTSPGFRAGVSNVLRNLRAPVSFTNHLLQGQLGEAGRTAARFAINTTFGGLGAFDVAERSGIRAREEDFGQTLARWRVPAGPYLFIPALGPTNVRDLSGRIVDTAFNPLTWVSGPDVNLLRGANAGATAVSTREALLDSVEQIEATSIDAYVSYRSNYNLLRESAISNGAGSVQDLPDFADIPAPDAAAPAEAPPTPEPPPKAKGAAKRPAPVKG